MKYSVDTSILIEGWRRLYPPDVLPSLWDALDDLIRSEELRASEEVLHDLERKDDDVFAWAKARPDLFIPIDEEIQEIVKEILRGHRRLIDTRSNRSSSDPFVIALARQHGAVVLTEEHATGRVHRPKIPDVCTAHDVVHDNLLGSTRTLGLQTIGAHLATEETDHVGPRHHETGAHRGSVARGRPAWTDRPVAVSCGVCPHST
jgi:hypothetical protein